MSITVTNNPNGTYTVTCGAESAVIGMPRLETVVNANAIGFPIMFPPISASGGGVVAHIIDADTHAPGATTVSQPEEILAYLQGAQFPIALAQAAPHVLEFSLQGQHSIDVGTIESALKAAGENQAIAARIYVGGKS